MTVQMNLTPNSRVIFDKRYPRKDEDGTPIEVPEEAAARVANNVASVTALYGTPHGKADGPDAWWDDFPYRTAHRQYQWLGLDTPFAKLRWDLVESQARRYYEMICRLDFLPNSPTWTGAGTPLGQLAACFVLPVEDDLGRTRDSIFETLKVAALIQQTGGGNGFTFGHLRPKGATVHTSMGRASGPVAFMEAYDATFGIMAQGGTRRGANMGIMPCHHPDVREFVRAKVEEGRIANFNISVAITDEFMEAVWKDGDFDLVFGDRVYETIRARDLYDELIRNAWVIGDPGALFIDRANRDNPCPTRYTLEATNPCAEQWLSPYENCCLGSINLGNFVVQDDGETYYDWRRLAEVTRLATQFLDDVVDANQYVDAIPELEAAAQGGRRIGLGGMGLADAMLLLGIRYGSEQGQEFASQVTEWMRYWSMYESIERAKERGPFGWIENSIYDPRLLAEHGPGGQVTIDGVTFTTWEPPSPVDPHTRNFGRPRLSWENITQGIIENGIRNSCQFTFAPTGTISNVAGCEGSGCEPVFALVYTRKVMQDGEDIDLHYASPLFEEALRDHGYTSENIAEVVEQVVAHGGSCQDFEVEVPVEVRNTFVVAADVTPEEHVRMQAAIQAFVDNSISKTINMPFEATVEDVDIAYRLAFDLGCKGITIYRQGSRQLEVLSTGGQKVSGEKLADPWPIITPIKVPDYVETEGLPTRTFKVRTPFGTMQAYITELTEAPGRPFDVRLQLGKAGNDKTADIEAIGRMASLALRGGVSVTAVVDQLIGIGGQTAYGFGPSRVRSAADGLGRLLQRLYLDDGNEVRLTPLPAEDRIALDGIEGEVDRSRVCPECHALTLVFDNGCVHCDVRLGGCGDFYGCD